MNDETLKGFSELPYEKKAGILSDSPKEFGLKEETGYVAEFLKDYRPLLPADHHVDNLSSYDIQEVLQNVCMIDMKDISKVMKMLGYRLYFNGINSPEWSMKHVEDI